MECSGGSRAIFANSRKNENIEDACLGGAGADQPSVLTKPWL